MSHDESVHVVLTAVVSHFGELYTAIKSAMTQGHKMLLQPDKV